MSWGRCRYLAAAAVASALQLPALGHATASIASLNVQPGDLPPGSVMKLDQTLNAQQLAVVEHTASATTFSKLGLRLSSNRIFDFSLKGEATAVLNSAIESFGTAAQAHNRYQNLVNLSKGALPGPPVSAPSIHAGDEHWAAAVTDTGTSDSPAAITFVEFRRGPYTVVIYVSGNSLAFTAAEATRLAARVDARMRAIG